MRIVKTLSVAIPVIVAMGTLLYTAIEYSKGQAWKRAEFLSVEVKEFEGAT